MKKPKTIADARDEERMILETLNDSLDDAHRAAKRMWKLHEERYGAEDSYLDEDGRFTTAGERRLHQYFKDGVKNSEIAKLFNVTDSAISYRRKKYDQKAA